jgi:hypothetical protein
MHVMETHSIRSTAPFGILLLTMMLAGCPQGEDDQQTTERLVIDTGMNGGDAAGADTSSDASPGCDGGSCGMAPPRGTPSEECPGGRFVGDQKFDGRGICQPASPEMAGWECPDSWRGRPAYLDADGEADVPEGRTQYRVCEPPPLPDSCEPGEMPLLGSTECVEHGTTCPDGETWLPASKLRDQAPRFTGDILYVSADTSESGDGSRAAPYSTVADAIAAAEPGEIVAAGKGTYEESVALTERIALVGACPAETRLEGSASDGIEGVVNVTDSGEATVANLTVGGERIGVSIRSADAKTRLHDVLVDRVARAGIRAAAGNEVEVRNLWVRETAGTSEGERGRGLNVGKGTDLTVERTTVQKSREIGAWIGTPGTTVTLRDVAVTGTRAEANTNRYGQGIIVKTGATLTAERVLSRGNRYFGLTVSHEDSSADLTDVIVAETRPRVTDDRAGQGLSVQRGASMQATRLLVRDNRHAGMVFFDGGADVQLQKVLVEGTRKQASDGAAGLGMLVSRDARVQGRYLHLHRNRQIGFWVSEGGRANVRDVVVTRTRSRASDGTVGRGMSVNRGGKLEATRLVLQQNRSLGLKVRGEGTTATLQDALVAGTRLEAAQKRLGRGVAVEKGADFEARRLHLRENYHVGLSAFGNGAQITLRDVISEGSRVREDGEGSGSVIRGDGIYLNDQSTEGDATIRRALLRDNPRAGLVAANSTARLVDVVSTRNGVGLVRQGESSVEQVRTRLTGNDEDDRRCRRECSEPPENPEPVDPFGN